MFQGPISVSSAAKPAPVEDDLCIYRNDWLFSFLGQHADFFTVPKLLLLYVSVFIGVKVILAYGTGVLWTHGWTTVAIADRYRYPLFSVLLRGFSKSGPSAPSPAAIPYLRDYSDILLMLFIAVQMVVIQRLWNDISIGPNRLYNDGIINIDYERYSQVVRRFDRWFNLRFWKILSLVLAIVLVAGAYYGLSASGMYKPLRAAGDLNWQHSAYDNWWANPAHHPLLFLYVFVVATFICYYTLRNNLAGLIAIFLCHTLFKCGTDRRGPMLSLDTSHPDGFGGIGILRNIVIKACFSVFNCLLCLFVIYCCFGWSSSIIPFYIAIMLLNPLFVLGPLFLIRRQVLQSKQYQIAECQKELQEFVRKGPADMAALLHRIHLEQQIAHLKAIPELLFSPSGMLAFCITYYLPTYQFIAWFINPSNG